MGELDHYDNGENKICIVKILMLKPDKLIKKRSQIRLTHQDNNDR